MPNSSRRLSPRHTKGVLTLALFVLAETVTFANAVSFWSKFQKVDNRFSSYSPDNKKKALYAKAPHQDSDGECSNGPSLFARARRTSTGSSILKSADCCRDCSHCMDAVSAALRCRGGHGSHAHAAATAAAEAAAQHAFAATAPYNIPLHMWKVIFQCFLTALNVMCWLIPLRSKKMTENKLALSLANAFSGGVFLSLAFGHLIPECVHGFGDTYNEATPFLLVLAGYLLIFFVEKVAFDAHDILHEMEHQHEHSNNDKAVTSNGSAAAAATTTSAAAVNSSSSAASGRSAVILLAALAVHSILEMMALGLGNSFGDCALLTLSISLHQPAESIALLVAFLKSGLSHSDIVFYLSIFSCMGPIGVMLGMLVNQYAAPIVDSIMLAVVAGTFVYVGATEVIPEEWEDSSNKWKKFAALMAGIVSIFGITQYTMTLGGGGHA